jgi:RNA polymerase sigma factor (sigma-70 family)
MKVALSIGGLVFSLGALIKLVIIAWLAIVAVVMAGASAILVRTGGLEPRTFGTCMVAAIVLDAVLLLAIFAALIATRVRPELTARSGGTYLRRPVTVTAAVLLVALLAVTAAGWRRSLYFPYPIATIVVLANAYYFLFIGVLNTARVLQALWLPLRAWGHSTPYRTGLLTASLMLLGLAGFAIRSAHWAPDPADRLTDHLGLDRALTAAGIADAQLTGLCVAAGDIAPELASSAAAPSCRALGVAGGRAQGAHEPGDDCFTVLENEVGPARGILRRDLKIGAYDAEDLAMDALLKTCLQRPPPNDFRAYFFSVVRNLGRKAASSARRTQMCEDVDERVSPPLCSSEQPELHELELDLVWRYTFCTLKDRAASVLRSRLVDGLPFRAIGERWEIEEDEARYIYNNAIKKLRSELGACLR